MPSQSANLEERIRVRAYYLLDAAVDPRVLVQGPRVDADGGRRPSFQRTCAQRTTDLAEEPWTRGDDVDRRKRTLRAILSACAANRIARLGLEIAPGGRVVMADLEPAETCDVRPSSMPLAVLGWCLISRAFARGCSPRTTLAGPWPNMEVTLSLQPLSA
jgi:hypothetical protein